MLKPKEKAKHHGRQRPAIIVYLGVWIISQIIGWVSAIQLWLSFRDFFIDSPVANALLVTLVPGLISALGQYWVIRRDAGESVRGWLWASLAGWGASAFFFSQYMLNQRFIDGLPIGILFAILFVPAAIVQTAWLYRRVKNAWLWLGAAFVSAAVFALPAQVSSADDQIIGVALAGLLQGLVMSMTMRQLWATPREKDKRETASDTQKSAAHDRLALANAEPDAAPDEVIDTERQAASWG